MYELPKQSETNVLREEAEILRRMWCKNGGIQMGDVRICPYTKTVCLGYECTECSVYFDYEPEEDDEDEEGAEYESGG